MRLLSIIWNAVNNGLFILVGVSLAYTMIGSVYYLKVIKIAYVDNPETRRSYAKVSPIGMHIYQNTSLISTVKPFPRQTPDLNVRLAAHSDRIRGHASATVTTTVTSSPGLPASSSLV
jgi:hypothetical protein